MNEAPELAIVSVGELFGGVERQILDLCRFRLAGGGSPPTVALFFDRELAARLRQLGLEPVILRGRSRYDPRLVDALAELLRARGVEVMHAHGYKATIACALAKRKVPCGLVKTEHGKPEARPGQPVAWLKARLNLALDRFLTRRYVDVVCYVTDDIAAYFARPHRGLRRQTVPNGIEPLSRADHARPADLPAGEIHLGIVGRVSAVKGIPIAIEALQLLRVPGTVRLKIIGTGPLVEPLRRAVAAAGLGEAVQFLGFRRNVFDYLAHLDILLMPSYHEGLPYTLLEAMSLERPIVASGVGGLREVLRDGDTGLLCPPGAAGPLAACLQRLLTDPELGAQLGRRARLDQGRRFTLETMGDRYADIYRRVRPSAGREGGRP